MEKFTLTIDLGNDGMQDGDDVARALNQVIRQLNAGRSAARVLDDNGNKVGEWQLS